MALGQINTARHLIDSVSKDYVRLLKFGDSLYRYKQQDKININICKVQTIIQYQHLHRCKQLKRAALGRMATVMRRQNQSLGYLEQVLIPVLNSKLGG